MSVRYTDPLRTKLHEISVKNLEHASNRGVPFMAVAQVGVLAVVDYLYRKHVGFEEFVKLVNQEIRLVLLQAKQQENGK